MWTQSDVKLQKMEYLWRPFLYGTETLYIVVLLTKLHDMSTDNTMATQWASSPLHPKAKFRVSLRQEVLFTLDVHSVGVSEYGHNTAQSPAQESLLDSGATNQASFILGR